MKIAIIFCFFLTLTVNVYSQNDSILKYTFNEENVVASAIDGSWKSEKTGNSFICIKDTTVLKLIPKKYYKYFTDKIIYHAGFLVFEKQTKKLPFILIENSGNPHLVYFREKNNVPLGDAESFNLFIAKGETRKEDTLYIGGDSNNQTFQEFLRTE